MVRGMNYENLKDCQHVFIEAESFKNKSGWVVDPIGSPDLSAHRLGNTVENARTRIEFPTIGQYHFGCVLKIGRREIGKPRKDLS